MKPNVWVYLSELPPNQMVEFGRVLPLHGKEAEWSAALPEAEKARLENIGSRRLNRMSVAAFCHRRARLLVDGGMFQKPFTSEVVETRSTSIPWPSTD